MSKEPQLQKSQISILDYQNFYLVGVKGVAMTSIAQCLLDAGKQVRGCDVAEDFVTAKILKKRAIPISNFAEDFLTENNQEKPDCLIYSAAHQGIDNPQVKKAMAANIPVYSQAEALANLFNQKEGIAVCGVGGKSTISAMLVWALKKLNIPISFSLGVGEIIGLENTGKWNPRDVYFIAEADEYAIDPNALKKGEQVVPRFSFLKPAIVVCSNLSFDHPDVYKNFAETKETFKKFFLQIKTGGSLVINSDNEELHQLALEVKKLRADLNIIKFSWKKTSDYFLSDWQIKQGQSLATVNQKLGSDIKQAQLRLKVPGQFNLMNALATIAALAELQIPLQQSCQALGQFRSTKRRFELVHIENSQRFFDDYAHHPHELSELIRSLNQYFPKDKKLIAFQPHTYSRTKALFRDFVEVLGSNLHEQDQLVILDIFASARERHDETVSSLDLVKTIEDKFPKSQVLHLKNIEELANYITKNNFNLTITVGAGDIYKVYELLSFTQ
jgi:UDP-N-acetylmuramate--alanine ligase